MRHAGNAQTTRVIMVRRLRIATVVLLAARCVAALALWIYTRWPSSSIAGYTWMYGNERWIRQVSAQDGILVFEADDSNASIAKPPSLSHWNEGSHRGYYPVGMHGRLGFGTTSGIYDLPPVMCPLHGTRF